MSAPSVPAEDSVSPTPSSGSARVAEPAPSQVDAQRPTALVLPSGTSVEVDSTATGRDGELAIPENVDRAGWWDGSARLGDPFGAIVVAAHVDSFTQGLGRFAELLSVRRGDRVEVQAGGLTQRFRIESAELVPKSTVRADSDIYRQDGAPRLVLITCAGPYDAATGYRDNLVVIAVPDGRLSG